MQRRANQLPAKQELVGRALLKRLGTDGRCDPSHATLADDTGVSIATVQRALKTLATLGMVQWVMRLVRDGSRVEQTSNAYVLSTGETPAVARRSTDRHTAGVTLQKSFVLPAGVDLERAKEAQRWLADLALRRQTTLARKIA